MGFSDWEEVVVKEEADFSVSKSERDRPCLNDSLMRTMMTWDCKLLVKSNHNGAMYDLHTPAMHKQQG